tara:strand:- start:8 stop:163 length:156 start_codon:yes stop_codon:yes gene_type:complete
MTELELKELLKSYPTGKQRDDIANWQWLYNGIVAEAVWDAMAEIKQEEETV